MATPLSINTTKLTELKNKANDLPNQNPPAQLQEKTVTPTKEGSSVAPDSGFDGLSKVTVNGDNNLVPENIKEGVSIFGVEGTNVGTELSATNLTKKSGFHDAYFNFYLKSTGERVQDISTNDTAPFLVEDIDFSQPVGIQLNIKKFGYVSLTLSSNNDGVLNITANFTSQF